MVAPDDPAPSLSGGRASERVRVRSALVRTAPKLAVSIVVGALLAWVAERGGVPLVPAAAAFTRVDWPLVGLAAALLGLVTFLRATRWRFLIAPVASLPLRDILLMNWVGFFAIFALPLRLGELARPAVGKLRAGIPVSVGLGTVAVERVIDGVLTSLAVAYALWLVPRLDTDDPVARIVPVYASAVLGVFLCALVALGAFLWKRELAVRLTEWGFSLISPRLGVVLAQKVDSVADGLRSIGSARLFSGFLAESLAYWGVNALFMWVLGVACGLPMEPGHALGVMGVLALGILLPSGPGLFGSFQVAVSAALKLYFAPAMVGELGAMYVFLLYGLNAVVMVIVGVIPLYAMDLRLRDLIVPRL